MADRKKLAAVRVLPYLGLCQSFLWFLYSLEDHVLTGPSERLSAFLITLVAGVLTYLGVGTISTWLPGATGRFDDELALTTTKSKSSVSSSVGLPRRPRRFFVPALVACAVVRHEAFIGVKQDFQCSKPGIEAFLPVLILAYELLPGRRNRAWSLQESRAGPASVSAPSRASNMDYFSLVGSAVLCSGVGLTMSSSLRSSTFCSLLDHRSWVVLLQLLGLGLDASLAVLVWRIVAWTRTTRLRMKTAGALLLQISVGFGFVLVSDLLLRALRPGAADEALLGIDSPYVFGVFSHGVALAVFVASSSTVMGDYGPAALANPLALVCALLAMAHRLPTLGWWEFPSRSSFVLAILLATAGSSIFLYTNSSMRGIHAVQRALILIVLLGLLIAASTFAMLRGQVIDRNPVQALIYDARVETDRWLVRATVSKTLKVAVQEYRKRHHGRDPPKGFDAWYRFAQERNSVVMDHFSQISDDVLPFWGVAPAKIREGIARLESEPDIAIVSVRDGQIFVNDPSAFSEFHPLDSVDGITTMMRSFANHLPNLQLAINLHEKPRVVTPWNELHGYTLAAKRTDRKTADVSLLGRDALTPAAERAKSPSANNVPTIGQFRQMNAKACPAGSPGRWEWHWNTRDICSACIKGIGGKRERRSQDGPFIRDREHWERGADPCQQPDMFGLHGFYMTPPAHPPLQELLPIFSKSKTSGFNDILIPWPRASRRFPDSQFSDKGLAFQMKSDKLLWRGEIEQPLRGRVLRHCGHQERLAHLINNASDSDTAIVSLQVAGKDRFAFERASARAMNKVLPLDVAFAEYARCDGGDGAGDGVLCNAAALAEFGPAKPLTSSMADTPPSRPRYVLLTDSDSGGHSGRPRGDDFLQTLESTSVPFVASVFREWFTERLTPWAHFVPVDLRFHDLHGALAHFTGLKGRGKVNGRDPEMDAHLEDGEWIAEQGKRWTARAIREQDAEVYLFRLLLEWGRVMSDERDELVFTVEDG